MNTISIQPKTAVLTGRERVNRMFERREHDRVPRYDSFWPETIRRWEGEGLVGGSEGVFHALDADLRSLLWFWPQAFPDRREVVSEDAETEVVRDGHGALLRFWKHHSGTPEHLGWECETPEIWREKYRPGIERQASDTALRASRSVRQDGRWSFLAGVEGFECARALLGDEGSLVAMLEEPEWIQEIAQVTTDSTLRHFQAVLDTGVRPDGIWIYGDMAYNHSTHCSPQTYRELVWPQHKRMATWAHERGMKFIFHTDGDVNAVIEMYIEAGFDCLQPLECKANMDIRNLCPRYGDRLAFFGNINVMELVTNDLERIETEIAQKLSAGKATRSYMYHSDHSIPPQISWQTYQEVIRLIDHYGNYE